MNARDNFPETLKQGKPEATNGSHLVLYSTH